MNHKRVIRYTLLAVVILFLVVLAGWAISGGVQQFPRTQTFGQNVETIIQILCGILSLLVIFTCFWWKKRAKPVRVAWGLTLVLMAGLSSLVWGPPMPVISLVFSGVTLLIVLAVLWVLRKIDEN